MGLKGRSNGYNATFFTNAEQLDEGGISQADSEKNVLGQDIGCCLSRFEKLYIYTEDALLNIDNYLVENAIRAVVVGRKNYLFAGSHDTDQCAAVIYSKLATCKLHDINPY